MNDCIHKIEKTNRLSNKYNALQEKNAASCEMCHASPVDGRGDVGGRRLVVGAEGAKHATRSIARQSPLAPAAGRPIGQSLAGRMQRLCHGGHASGRRVHPGGAHGLHAGLVGPAVLPVV